MEVPLFHLLQQPALGVLDRPADDLSLPVACQRPRRGVAVSALAVVAASVKEGAGHLVPILVNLVIRSSYCFP